MEKAYRNGLKKLHGFQFHQCVGAENDHCYCLGSDVSLSESTTSFITTKPFLPNNIAARHYSDLKLVVEIAEPSRYSYCSLNDINVEIFEIFDRSTDTFCGNSTDVGDRSQEFDVKCSISNSSVIATAAFVSPVNEDKVYLLRCFATSSDLDRRDIANFTLHVSGTKLLQLKCDKNYL